MKLTILLLTVGFLNVYAKGVSQTVSFTGEKVPLKSVFNSVKQQTGFVFLYSGAVLQVAKPVTVSATAVPLETFLNEVFKNQPLKYTIKGKSVFIAPKPASDGPPVSNVPANVVSDSSVTIRGRVLNEKGEPVPGASVTVKGSTKGTRTDGNGDFALRNVISGEYVLITSVGYETNTILINRFMGTRSLELSLKPAVTKLDEIEITVNTGYQVLSKERSTGSQAQIDNKLLNRSPSGNILDRLEGVTNGMLFTRRKLTKEDVNGSAEIRVRGLATILGSSSPLIVLDNFPYEGDINSINPNDIESVTVLKDAAAASIWGARAGNGVIVVNTKAGRYNQVTRISINSNVVVGDKPDLYYSQNYLPSATVMDIQKENFNNGAYFLADFQRIPLYAELLQKLKDKLITQQEFDEQEARFREHDIRDDWSKYLYRKSITQQHALNVRGGGNNYRYMFSAGFDKDRQMYVGNEGTRMNLSLQNTFKVRPNLELTGTVWYTKRKSQTNAVLSSVTNTKGSGPDIYESLMDENGYANPVNIQINRYKYQETFPTANPNLGMVDWLYRPLDEIGLNDNRSNTSDFRLNGGLKYKFLTHFSFDLSYQYILSINERTSYHDVKSYFARDFYNQYTQTYVPNITDNKLHPVPLGNIMEYPGAGQTNTQSSRALLNYNQVFNTEHSISAIGGAEIRQSIATTMPGATLFNYNPDLLTSKTTLNFDSSFATRPSGRTTIPTSANKVLGRTTNRYLSYFGNASYTYKDRYIVSGSGRWDGSNLLGVRANMRGTLLWSTGLSWDISKESFFKVKQLPYLRLRATYGSAGNIDPTQTHDPTLLFTTINTVTSYQQANLNSAGNPSLRWEQINTLNFGTDFRAFKNRISGSVEYYVKNAKYLLSDNAVDPTTGVPSTFRLNFSAMRAWGYDVQINTKNLELKKFSWTSTFIFNASRNKITKMRDNIPTLDNQYFTLESKYLEQGQSVDRIYSLPWHGLDPQDGSPLIYDKDGGVRKDFLAYWNGIKKSDFIYAGVTVPLYSTSLMNTFEWNGIAVSALVVGRFGSVIRRTSTGPGVEFTSLNFPTYNMDLLKRWKEPGDEKFTDVPAKVTSANSLSQGASNQAQLYQYSEKLIIPGDVIRLQDVNLSYTLPHNLIKRWPIQSLRVYGYVHPNTIIWKANKDGIDPDYPYTNYPDPKSYSAGLQVEF
ncbi:hypothetical protein A4H97_27705 [Niastella yeongjuensis]|uniref:TonB-dependent receptor plug domain-containing protein n=1 Tax=Niastella yeongjuensis TaxID=354355 RepID=A0A1V9EYW9_9BACT|nr:SusC/RagA family TonB-linked outer membrane protein [Niastella yeongjuensis]OQP51363.1 hypothetical protein A4H97_27705 [Niastella yeongjuensis]